MRILLRLIAGFTLLSVIGTLVLVIGIWQRGGMLSLAHLGSFGILTVAGWVITLVVGPPAAVLLWKQNDAGRIAAIVVWASVCLYYLFCAALFRNPNTLSGKMTFDIAGSAVLVFFLLSSRARQACQTRHLSMDPPIDV
jgi:hypothetical protein